MILYIFCYNIFNQLFILIIGRIVKEDTVVYEVIVYLQ